MNEDCLYSVNKTYIENTETVQIVPKLNLDLVTKACKIDHFRKLTVANKSVEQTPSARTDGDGSGTGRFSSPAFPTLPSEREQEIT